MPIYSYSSIKSFLADFNKQLGLFDELFGLNLKTDKSFTVTNLTREGMSVCFSIPYYDTGFWGTCVLFLLHSWQFLIFCLLLKTIKSLLFIFLLAVFFLLFKQGSIPVTFARVILAIFSLWKGVGSRVFNLFFYTLFVSLLLLYTYSDIKLIPFFLQLLIFFRTLVFVAGLGYRSSARVCFYYLPSTEFVWDGFWVDLHPILDRGGEKLEVGLDGSIFSYKVEPSKNK